VAQYVLTGVSGMESIMSQKKAEKNDAGRFVTVTPSGSVTVELGGFLKSSEGQKQLEQIRELRNFTHSNASARSSQGKKVG
jgi:hypothetical protein